MLPPYKLKCYTHCKKILSVLKVTEREVFIGTERDIMEITPFIKKGDNTPIYVQLYQFFREEIECGRIEEGTKLPSIRQLSQKLNISKNTVETAYQQLVAEGYAEGKEKSGIFVLKVEDLRKNLDFKEIDISEREELKKEKIDFQYGDIELERFPLKAWKKCLLKAIEKPNQEVFSYGEKKGNKGLRREIAQYLQQARGAHCSSDQIIICAGTQHSIILLCQLIGLADEKIAIENPGYDGVRLTFENQQCNLVPIPLEMDGLNIEELEKSEAKCAYVTPSHQFPLGMILPIQKRMRLLQWAYKNSSYIIEDDYDGEFRYQGQPVPSLKSLDTNDQVIYLGTFSKAFLPSARVSYMVLPQSLVRLYQERFSFYNQAVSPLIQEALYYFLKDGHFSGHIRKMRKIYHEKQKLLLDSIAFYLGDNVKVIGQKAGLHLLLEFPQINSEELVKKADQMGVTVYLTEKYWYKSHSKSHQPLILGYGGVNEVEMKRGVQLLAKAFYDLLSEKV